MEAGVRPRSQENGAEVVGGVKHPLGTTDFSSYVLQAKAANPDVIALNSGGDDTDNALKATREFGLKAKLVGLRSRSAVADQGDGPRYAQGV